MSTPARTDPVTDATPPHPAARAPEGRAAPSEFARFLRTETWGGIVLLAAAVLALAWANSPWSDAYHDLFATEFGPERLHLHLSLDAWIRDGLLAIFFFVVGLELKRELVVGELADRRAAAFPVVAALGGVVVPALVAAVVMWGEPGLGRAWAVPTATDIAFALGVLAILGSHLPDGVRLLLLALAVVDDLVAIILIAVLFSHGLALLPLLGFAACCAAWALAQRLRIRTPLLYVPLALAAWALLHASGVHATIAGVALGLLTRVRADAGEHESPAVRLEHRLQPWSAGVVVPLFAIAAAGVTVAGGDVLAILREPVGIGIIAGLVVGKWVGITGASLLAERLGIGRRPDGVTWGMVNAIAVLGGIGFTVSLLVADLALDGAVADHATLAVLAGSLLASLLAAVLLRSIGRPTVPTTAPN